MCRHLAYLGPPVSLRSLLVDPPHSLYRQAWAPRYQRFGTVNADGFGIGWYAGGDPVPARYRRSVPIWGDPSLPDLARVTRSAAVLAAVRSATEGTALGEAAAAPFGTGSWLFSHNGRLAGWPATAAAIADDGPQPDGPGGGLPQTGAFLEPPGAGGGPRPEGLGGGAPQTSGLPEPLGAAVLLSLEAMVDSAFLWALVLQRLRAGVAMDAALAQTIVAVEAAGGTGRFNFLLTDGHSIAATACGDTLWWRRTPRDTADTADSAAGAARLPTDPRRPAADPRRPGADPAGGRVADPMRPAADPAAGRAAQDAGWSAAAVTVASEPCDDEPGWVEVPDRHVLTATAGGVSIRPLPAPQAAGPVRQAADGRAREPATP
jgi:gamma-glutamyl hercynylcysteine S-oxide hydrolase